MGKDKKHKKKRHHDVEEESATATAAPSTSGSYGPALPPPSSRDSWMTGDDSTLFDSLASTKKDVEKEKEKTPEYDYSAAGLHIMSKGGEGTKNRLFARQKTNADEGSSVRKDIEKMKARFKKHNRSRRDEEGTDDSRSQFRAPDSKHRKDRNSGHDHHRSYHDRREPHRKRSQSPLRKSESPKRKKRDASRSCSPASQNVRQSEHQPPVNDDPQTPLPTKDDGATVSSEKTVTDDDLNKLSARIVKAEIMGNNEKVAKLNTKLKELRKLQHAQQLESSKKKNTIILTTVDKKGNVRPVTSEDVERPAERKRRKEKTMPTHSSDGVRDKYFPDDNNKELADLVRDEKSINQLGHDELFMKYAGKLSKMSQDRQNWTLDDMFETNIAKIKHKSGKDVDKIVAENTKEHKKMESCHMCLEKASQESIVHIGKTLYVRVPPTRSLTKNHCQIIPINHIIATVNGDEDFWEELSTVKSALTKTLSKLKLDIVFLEIAQRLGNRKHIFIDCVPVPLEESALLPAYFKKAILDSDVEWSHNKKLVDTREKGLRRSIPQGLPYFSVEFGKDGGYAHVIEDESLFKRYFGLEIIGGVLDCDAKSWRHPERESSEGISYKKSRFEKLSISF